jgi:hypothetical protein
MSFGPKPNRPDSKDTAKLRAEYEKKAQEFRDTGDPATKAKLRDEKQKLFQRVVQQQVHERRENLADAHRVLAKMGRYKTDEQMAAEKAKAEVGKTTRLANESR